METRHRDVLRQNRTFLLDEILNIADICDILHEDNILTNTMVQDIMAEKTMKAQNRKFLDILPRRGGKAFDAFCVSLQKTHQVHIAHRINPGFVEANPIPVSPGNGASKTISLAKPGSKPVKTGEKSPIPIPIAIPIKTNESKGSITPVVINKSVPQPINTNKISATTEPLSESPHEREPVPRKENKKRTKTPPLFDDERLYKIIHPKKGWPGSMDLSLTSLEFKVETCSEDENDEDIYPMSKDYTKRALIICNRDFDERYEDRKIADMDSFRLLKVFKQFGFTVDTCTSLTEQELWKKLEEEKTQKGSANNLSIFMLVISSYGGKGTVICKDNKEVYIQDIVNMFTSRNCPLMTGVPKLFLIQACGVKMKDYPLGGDTPEGEETAQLKEVEDLMSSLQLSYPALGDNKVDTQASMHTSSSEQSLSDPLNIDNDDILVAMATTADNDISQQFRSQFLLGLSYMLCHHAKSEHFVNILKGINMLKEKESCNEPMKLCEFKHSLAKKLYLKPM